MEQNFISELKALFQKLPGIGPRQANRFIWALLDFTPHEQQKLSRAVAELSSHLRRCQDCFRVFTVTTLDAAVCSFCRPSALRDGSQIMVVEKDSDLLNIERAGLYEGLYHVLGATLDPLNSAEPVRERIKALYNRAAESKIREVILAMPANKMGEFTSEYIRKVLGPLPVKATKLGRGLSAGMELEYADEHTLRHAFNNRV